MLLQEPVTFKDVIVEFTREEWHDKNDEMKKLELSIGYQKKRR